MNLARWAVGGLLICAASASAADGLQTRYFRSVFSGDLSWMLAQDLAATGNQRLVGQFRERFLERSEPAAFQSIDDPFVRRVAADFQRYWVESLLNPHALAAHEQALERSLAQALDEYCDDHGDLPVLDRVTAQIRDRGWGFQGGRTPPLLDFILWRSTNTQRYDVALTDGTQAVDVHFLDGFVSQGWAHFATFGHAGTGGWSADDGLYCIASSYDLSSERFLVSYLKHEARHFADNRRFPELNGTDLEYRAKLTELIYAQADQLALLTQFSNHADAQASAPHPLANWRVLQDLSRKLRIESDIDQPERWRSVDADAIRNAARVLLESNSQRLIDTGANTTSSGPDR